VRISCAEQGEREVEAARASPTYSTLFRIVVSHSPDGATPAPPSAAAAALQARTCTVQRECLMVMTGKLSV